MPPLDVLGTTPVLIVGKKDVVRGEMWLSNPTPNDIHLESASITVTLPTGAESGPVPLSPDAFVPKNGVRRLVIEMGMHPLTPPAAYPASLTLVFPAPTPSQTIPASMLITAVTAPELIPDRVLFHNVKKSTSLTGTVVVRNDGNVPIVVGQIPDEQLLEVRAHPRLLAVTAGGAVVVEPSIGLAPAGVVTFTNTKPTVAPGSWSPVDFTLKTPTTLVAHSHLRALPRIGTERFAVDLLTIP